MAAVLNYQRLQVVEIGRRRRGGFARLSNSMIWSSRALCRTDLTNVTAKPAASADVPNRRAADPVLIQSHHAGAELVGMPKTVS